MIILQNSVLAVLRIIEVNMNFVPESGRPHPEVDD